MSEKLKVLHVLGGLAGFDFHSFSFILVQSWAVIVVNIFYMTTVYLSCEWSHWPTENGYFSLLLRMRLLSDGYSYCVSQIMAADVCCLRQLLFINPFKSGVPQKVNTDKQWKPRSERGVWSGSRLFALTQEFLSQTW